MNFTSILIHFVGAALSCAQLAYWSIRLMTPPPAAAPVPARAVPVRDPDPVLVARAFGQIDRIAAATLSNIQVAGVFSAGLDSAAVFVVDDQPARAVLLGQEVTPGATLVEVNPQSVTLQTGPTRRELRVPNPPFGQLLRGRTRPGCRVRAAWQRPERAEHGADRRPASGAGPLADAWAARTATGPWRRGRSTHGSVVIRRQTGARPAARDRVYTAAAEALPRKLG